jgi:hypothetical protein
VAITFKKGVDCTDIHPLVFRAILAAHECYNAASVPNLVVTSLRDGKHKPRSGNTSLHYSGKAVDLRTWNVPDQSLLPAIVQAMRAQLGPDFDIVLEKDHVHCEFDKKG